MAESADYDGLKVVELKALLKERGISSTGLTRKSQIIEALQKNDAEGHVENDEGEQSGSSEGEQQNDSLEPPSVAGVNATRNAHEPSEDEEAVGEAVLKSDEALPESVASPSAQATEVDTIAAEVRLPTDPPTPADITTATHGSSTPPQSGYASDEQSSEARKRKRRSPTPPLDEETVNKKLKAADQAELPAFPEDAATQSEEQMDVDSEQAVAAKARVPTDGAGDGDGRTMGDAAEEEWQRETPTVDPAIHPATTALYIRHLMRPLQATALQRHLEDLALPPNSTTSSDSEVKQLHLDSIKTHAFAVFNSVNAASRVRSRLHGTVWPQEHNRASLWVDFVPESSLAEWIELESAESGNRINTRRWEVEYSRAPDGSMRTELKEAEPARQQALNMGVPGAPTGPRRREPKPPTITSQPPPQVIDDPVREAPSQDRETLTTLDQKFRMTTTEPQLYWQPVGEALVARRQQEMERYRSRDSRRNVQHGPGGQLRRYTFEDGDRLVDGGPDFGSFGRTPGGVGGDSFRPGAFGRRPPPGNRGGRYRR